MTLMGGLVKLTALLFMVLSVHLGVEGLWCDRTPAGVHVPKTPGDNGYKIVISGDSDKYIPGGVYSVRLQGPGDQYTVEKFSGFLLVAEPGDAHSPESSAGSFQLTSDSLARFSEFCPHAVKHASELPKAEVQVRWTAPPVSAGCVVFRATIIKNKGQWFMDDGALTKQLCPENEFGQDEGENFEPCCACDEAKYELTFEGLWSPLTHPKDFPANTLSAHFSDIIGASHSPNFRFWEYGGDASEGVKNIAEQGDSRALESELKEKSGNIRTIIKARGLKHPNFYGYKTFAVFRADRDHNLISLVSKIDPSPDWFVGVSGLNLCLSNCSWAENKVVNLFPWDAGTNNGITYSSPGEPIIPQERIRRIVWNSNENSPFYDLNGSMVKPFARLRLVKQRSYERACDTDYRRTGNGDTAEDELHDESAHQHRPECQVSLWSEFGRCSATCGRGHQMRTRTYVNEIKAIEYGCRRKLKDTTGCLIPGNCNAKPVSTSSRYGGSSSSFSSSSAGSGSSNNHRGSSSRNRDSGRGRSHPCATTDYGAWSLCSAQCGRGVRRRTREYLDPSVAREYNCRENLQQQEVCEGRSLGCSGGDDEQIEPGCEVTDWSEWSECSVTCGKGSRKRTRLYANPRLNHQKCSLEMTQYETCEGIRPDCNEPEDWKEICKLPKAAGMCPNDGNLTRWYFDIGKLRCQKFTYQMCKGNQNNFVTEKDCEDKCNVLRQNLSEESMYGTSRTVSSTWPAYQPVSPYGAADGPSMDCAVSKWSKWSKCSTTCGQGFRARTRYIRVFNENGGRPCPHLRETQTCTDYTCQPTTPYRYMNFELDDYQQ